jgi:glutamate racemase
MKNRPIGLFDSGFGGLTVMREVAKILPHEHLIYFGDTAHLPYGNKSPEAILRLAKQNAAFLLSKEIKLLMIPCHTACCHALTALQKELPIPVIGVIESGLELVKHLDRVAILGTTSTIESQMYQSLIQAQNPRAFIYAQACPLFVPLIEEGFCNHPAMSLAAESYLNPLIGKVDAVLLACTHYPLARQTLSQLLGPNIQLLEPAEKCALQVKDYLSKVDLLNPQTEKPIYEFYVSDDPAKFRKLGEIFLGYPIEKNTKVYL